MTTTLPKIPDPLVVLKRAERAATGEEPGDLSHLADAVRTQIVEPLTAGGTPVVDDVQVKQLRADKERLEGIVAESRSLAASRGKTVEAQAREIADLKRQLADRPASGVDASLLEQTQRDNARLADELACARRDLRAANATLDEIADEQADQPAHVHRYPVDLATGQRGHCSCHKPWIRDLVHDGEEVVPDVEPLDQLFARIRTELGEAS